MMSGIYTETSSRYNLDDSIPDPIDDMEIYTLIKDIYDPEHPSTLEQLHIVSIEDIKVDNNKKRVAVIFTPTVPHCTLSRVIGLCVRTRLMRSLPCEYKLDIKLKPGTHDTEDDINKQLNDKERCIAALENPGLLQMVNKCLLRCDR